MHPGTYKRPGMSLKELVSQDEENEKWVAAFQTRVVYVIFILLFQI